jgi:hypothetical protein
VAQSEVVLKFGASKGDQVPELFSKLQKVSQPTVGDLLFVGQRQRSRMLQRTSKGIDVNGRAFVSYSLNRPVYYYPGVNRDNKSSAGPKTMEQTKAVKGRERSVNRIANLIGLKGRNSRPVDARSTNKSAQKQYVQRTAKGLKFSSYAAFKAAFGRTNVDLRGIQAPNMLQSMVVRVLGWVLDQSSLTTPEDQSQANEIKIGIYGYEAQRASGHQKGTGHLPKRAFIGANDQDKSAMLADASQRVAARIRSSLGLSAVTRTQGSTL